MKISLNWLKTYISFDFSPEDLSDRLTMTGFEVEEIQSFESPFKRIVVGEVKEIKDHPESDKLKVCQVDIGSSQKTIICGAPNIAKGQFVPVAMEGVVLDGNTVGITEIKGVISEAVICSERELGLSDDHSGVLVLNDSSRKTGAYLFPEASQDDTVFDVNVTPNRPDCLSHVGIAREIGCISGRPVQHPNLIVKESDSPAAELVTVHIDAVKSCPRYSARVIQNVKIGPSPPWMKSRLEAVGIRSINNVVDVTNYTLMELGHPLHAFDFDLVQGRKIVVRHAEKGETFTTLDEIKRDLQPQDLLICDGERPVALAGVMGGLNSEVSASTKDILLESAYFEPATVRKTAKRLSLSTEASQRFERGADPNGTLTAADRCAVLLSELAEGSVCRGIVDAYPNPIGPREIQLRPGRIAKVLGAEIPRESVTSILTGLDLKVENSEDQLTISVPTFRPDLEREIDLIEEIVRHYGYEKIEPRLRSVVPLTYSRNEIVEFTERLKDHLTGMGFQESLSNSMVSEKHIRSIIPEVEPLHVTNPINPETSCLRMSLISTLLDTIQWNQNRSTSNARFFEIGRVFFPNKKTLPDERITLTGMMSGSVRAQPFCGDSTKPLNMYHLKGLLESLFERLFLPDWNFIPENHHAFDTHTSLRIVTGETHLGTCGEITGTLREMWDITESVFGFEISVQALSQAVPKQKKYKSIPKYPAVKRDLAVMVEEKVPVGDLESCIAQNGGKMLTSIGLFDLYQGQQIPSGKKSVAFSLTFSVPDRTLKEEEVDPIFTSILESLKLSFAAELRS